MRWEKWDDWEELLQPMSHLSVPGESYFRAWESWRKVRRPLPSAVAGLEFVLLDVFLQLKESRRREKIEREIYRTSLLVLLAQSLPGADVSKARVDQILTLFYQWHKVVDPSAPKPQSQASDDLLAQMEALKDVFENPDGFRVTPAGR